MTGELLTEYEAARTGYAEHRQKFYEKRAFFDNTHESMTNVWHFNQLKKGEVNG